MKEIWIRNRQRRYPVQARGLRLLTHHLLETLLHLESYQLGIHLVGPRAMARVNQDFLSHEGPTDVITFNHAAPGKPLYGELFICPAVADSQAMEFKTTRTEELVRYVVHGVLHLRGYDDTTPDLRRQMKRVENRLFLKAQLGFHLSELGVRLKVDGRR